MKRILVYVRPWNREQFIDLAEKVFPDSRITIISEHASADSSGFVARFAEAYDSRQTYKNQQLWHNLNIEDVILRCRLLRNIPRTEAERLVNAMAATLENFANENSFDAILSVTTDSYIQHMMVIFSETAKIPFIGLVPTFVNGYFRITSLGELNECRDVSTNEVEKLLHDLSSKNYLPSFVTSSASNGKNETVAEWAKNILRTQWFRYKRMRASESLNYHYWASEVVSRQFLSTFPQSYSGLHLHDLDLLKEIKDGIPLIYLPLQMSPEATIDYWSADSRWVWYEKRILEIIGQHKNNFKFIVKEHPNVYGRRTKNFYRNLSKMKNVHLISPWVLSNQVLDACDAIMISTGSAGFEAMLRDIPVISDCEPWHLGSFVEPLSVLEKGIISVTSNNNSKHAAVERLLRGILPGEFNNNGMWRHTKPEQLALANQIATALTFMRRRSLHRV